MCIVQGVKDPVHQLSRDVECHIPWKFYRYMESIFELFTIEGIGLRLKLTKGFESACGQKNVNTKQISK